MIIHQINHGQSNLYYYNLQTMTLRNLIFLKDQFMIFAGYQMEKISLLLQDIYLQKLLFTIKMVIILKKLSLGNLII